MTLLIPSYKSGFACNAAESENPNLWKGLVGLWAPSLGPTGLTLRDQSGYGNHGTLTFMDPATDWVVSEKGWALDFDGSSDHIKIGEIRANAGRFSVVCLGNIVGSDGDGWILGDRSANENAVGIWANFGSQSIRFADGTSVFYDWGNAADVQGWRLWSFVYDDPAVILGLDLELKTSSVAGKTITWSAVDSLATRSGSEFEGPISLWGVWNRALHPAEIQQLYVDPHALLRPRRRVFAAVVAGAIMNQMQGSNLGADLYNGTLVA